MSQEVVTQLERIVQDFEAATIPAGTSALDRAVEQISRAFRVRQDEVAILVLIGEGKTLQFLIPEKLKGIGTIPLTSTKALAARTVREKRASRSTLLTPFRLNPPEFPANRMSQPVVAGSWFGCGSRDLVVKEPKS